MAAAASAVALGAFAWYLLAPAERSPAASAEKRFVADVRARPIPAALARAGDDDLVALGRRFCDALGRRGSSLAVLFEDQLAGRVYDGETEVVVAAQRHLCPGVADADRRAG